MRRLNKWATATVLVGGVVSLLAIRSVAQDETPIFHTGTNLVPLHVSVLDKNGKLVTNLPQSAFHVFEDKVEQPLKVFRREDVPVSMGILIDNSGSMRDKHSKVAAAALALVKASNPDDEVFIVTFNDEAMLEQDFTNDIKKLEASLVRIDSHGGTAMRTAISASLDHLKMYGKKDKKVLVVVTDGNDNSSGDDPSQEQMIRKVQSADNVLVYSIGLLDEEEPREAKAAQRALKQLAEASGGFAYFPKDLAEVENITPVIAKEIRNQYTLAYTPLNPSLDGSFRSIRVEVKGYGQVRAKNGYYAKPPVAAKESFTKE